MPSVHKVNRNNRRATHFVDHFECILVAKRKQDFKLISFCKKKKASRLTNNLYEQHCLNNTTKITLHSIINSMEIQTHFYKTKLA